LKLFKKLFNGESVAEWKNGYGAIVDKANMEKLVAEFRLALEEKRKAFAVAQKLEWEKFQIGKTAEPRLTAMRHIHYVEDHRSLTPDGTILSVAEDAQLSDFAPLLAGNDSAPQISVRWDDGMRARINLFEPRTQSAYASQGRMIVRIDGEPSAVRVDAALKRLSTDLGLDTRIATPEDLELTYLKKMAYVRKVDQTKEWSDLLRDSSKLTKADQVKELRGFWNLQLGVDDVTKLPNYRPAGIRDASFNLSSPDAGSVRYYRFDLDGKEDTKALKKLKLFHTPTYGGGSVSSFFRAAIGSNNSLVSTTEKLRIGIPVRGASPGADFGTGGAAYVFTRLKTSVKAQGIYWKATKHLKRMDAISYGGDKFGRTIGTFVSENRVSTIPEWQSISKISNNETIFKSNLSLLDDLEAIVVSSESERAEVLSILREVGVDELADGTPVVDLVKVAR